ncbi:MAG: DinB family protein [Candidatus Acidiferrales bacterium]
MSRPFARASPKEYRSSSLRFAYRFDYPFPPEEGVDFFHANYGPMTRAFASLDAKGQESLRGELVLLWTEHNYSRDNTTKVDGEYLEVIATRSGSVADGSYTPYKPGGSMTRAQALADRLEDGAASFAAFAEGLSEAEWNTATSATDHRTIGVIVHHVANMYPIEIDVAKLVAGGKAITDVTWEVVADINAKHAREQAHVTKAAALELLRRNSREAAAAVREFTDEELDRAAAFSLSFGAPVTAQFVIEDHAMRHSWHHLARIRKALGR